ncbi:MAG: winged helix DNA-binding domain-containing protein [Acidimicrobiia bacterium]
MDDLTLARWRVNTLRLSSQTYPSAPAVVSGLLGVQAENYAQASWAVAARTSGMGVDEFDALFDSGAILRTHVLRPTWHFVSPEDIRWLIEVTVPRIWPSLAQLQRSLDISDDALDASSRVISESLLGNIHLTREAIGERLEDSGLPGNGQALGLALSHAELSALICSGALMEGRHTHALLDERAPKARRLDRDGALAELVLRYFTGHGPATERDLAYWASLTVTDVRKGLAQVSDQLGNFDHDGRTFWYGEPPPPDNAPSPRAHLLQILDEYYRGYQDSRYVLDVAGIVPRGREASTGMVLVDTQMVGNIWRTVRPDGVRFDFVPFRDLEEDELQAVHEAGDRYGVFLGLPARVDTRSA